MSSGRTYHLNSDADVARYLRSALDAVTAAEIPHDLQGIAFTKAIDLLSHKQVNGPPVGEHRGGHELIAAVLGG